MASSRVRFSSKGPGVNSGGSRPAQLTTERVATRFLLAGLVAAACLHCGAQDDEFEELLTRGEKRYSQFDEELIIRHFFQDRRSGFFLDVGSGPPERNSTTYYLEKHLGWAGIGVDALPEYAAEYRRLRPATRFFNYIVTDHSGGAEFFYRVPDTPGLSSVIQNRVFHGRVLEGTEIEIPTITLNDLLAQSQVAAVDFLSMDIEGSAPAALAGFDLERFHPELVCIEARRASREYRGALKHYFNEHGYGLIERYLAYDTVNWYFRPRD